MSTKRIGLRELESKLKSAGLVSLAKDLRKGTCFFRGFSDDLKGKEGYENLPEGYAVFSYAWTIQGTLRTSQSLVKTSRFMLA